MNNDLLRLAADVDQDRAALEEWWKAHTDEEKMLVWEAIQREFDEPLMEIVSRFAQLAFSEAALLFSPPAGFPGEVIEVDE